MMPGSSSSPSNAPSKAKVTNGGIFVRPVAVAGIFCPASDSDSKPPALPEKRRFSALVGDLRPCSSDGGPASEDFSRRRQSWDTRQKEVPFGQALLRKTPRQNNPTPKSVKEEEAKDQFAVSNVVVSNNSASTRSSVSSTASVSDHPELAKEPSVSTRPVNNVNCPAVNSEIKREAVSTRPENNVNCSSVNSEIKRESAKANCNSVKANNSDKIVENCSVPNEKANSKISLTSNTSVISSSPRGQIDSNSNFSDKNLSENKTVSSTENTKQPKKVYGLIKRESKSDVLNTPKDSAVGSKDAATNVTLNKTKVYGVNKTIAKKDSESVVQGNEQAHPEPSENCVSSNDSKVVLRKTPDSKDSKILESKNSKESLNEKKINQPSVSPPKDFRTVRRTSDVIAAKIQNIFSNFQSEKSTQPAPKKSQYLEKRGAPVESREVKTKTEAEAIKVQTVKSYKPESSAVTESTKITTEKDESKITVESNGFKSDVSVQKQEDKICDKNLTNCNSTVSSTKFVSSSDIKNEKQPLVKNVSLGRQNGSVVNIQNLRVDAPRTLEVSKTEYSISTSSSKQQEKKLAAIEGKMPTKNADQNISGGANSSLITTNGETDRKSSGSSTSLSTMKENANKDPRGVNKQTVVLTSNTASVSVRGKNTANSFQSSFSETLNNTDRTCNRVTGDFEKKFESHSQVKESSYSSTSVAQSFISTDSFQKTSYSSSSSSFRTEVQKSSESSKTGGSGEASEISKVEIAKITPSTVPGIVPTVNVLFRTKSPQGVANRDENRKKVVIETYSSDGPISSAVIVPPPPKSSSSNSATESVREAFKAIEDVQKSLNSSPALPKKHTIVNLKKEEVVTVSLASNLNSSEPLTTLNGVVENVASNNISHSGENLTKYSDPIISDKFSTDRKVISGSDVPNIVEFKSSISTKPLTADSLANSTYKEANSYSSAETKMSVVDLGDWNKKFQSSELEAPRVPLRRRALRDSLPPSLPLRSLSRYGSLKRIEDSPRYVPRSPSQSSLPQRYSYTEMLSKVCSMGVLPYTESMNSKSCSSSSSQVSELWSELSEEQSTATHASEMLEAETSERMRLEKEVHELQSRYSQVQQRSDKMEMEMIETRMFRSPEINGDLSDDEIDGNSSIYKQKYERAVRDMEIMKRRMQQQQEEEMEQKAMMKKASEKRLAEALEDVEEERQIANQWKRKAQKLGAELQDLRLMLEEQMGRNGELEKKQRRFDAELSAAQEEIKKERLLREKLMREKDQAISEKYSLEQDLQSTKLDSDMLHEKIAQLNRELDELTLSSKGEEEVTQLKRAKQELERKTRDQEEELEELAAQVQMLEQAKLRLEMSLEKVRQEHRREASVREEEIEEIRASFSKKIKNIEAQLESEQDERHQLMKQKHELERRIYEIADQPPPQDPEIERRLRRDLKRTKALLRDAQSMLEHTREGQSSKTLIRQLKNQLEDSEFAKTTAVKARQAIESELQECQLQLEEVTRVKNEAESRCLQLSREKSAIQTQLEEAEEEMAEVMKKYKAVVAQMSIDQKTLAEQNQQIAELETERQMLKDQLSEVSHKFEHLSGQSDDTHKVHWLDSKIRDLESKLELEQTTKTRLENQIARLKEQNDRSREECDSLRNKEMQAQEGVRRLQRQLRDLREDYSALQQKEADAYRKQHELEMALENTETDLQVTKNDLRLACQRIQDLQNALEDDLDSGTDVPDDSGSDSDDSFELSVLRNTSVTPVQRCDSVASNLSYCTTEEARSRTSSFSRELSAFSRMMLSRTSRDFLG